MKKREKGVGMEKPGWIGEIQVVGWDLDGTLYPRNPKMDEAIRQIQVEMICKVNDWEPERAEKELLERYEKLGSFTKTMISLGVNGKDFYGHLWEALALEQYIERDEKMTELFGELSGYRHFMITNSNPREQLLRKLELIGLDPSVFEFIITTYEMEVVKPDPQPFLVALEKLEVEPQQVLFVGDKVTTDIEGAKGVEMRTCLVGGESDIPDICISSVYDVLEVLT